MYYMRRKAEASEKLKEYMSWVKARGWYVGVIKFDRGSEFFGSEHKDHLKEDKIKSFVAFEKVAAEWGSRVEAAPRAGSTGNGIVERYHRTLFELASGFLLQSNMLPLFWVEAPLRRNIVQ